MSLWTLGEIADAVGVSMAWKNRAVGTVHTDSREVVGGGLFVALRGATQHGNDFVPEALRNGAGVVIDRDREIEDLPVPFLLVKDSYAAFVALARVARGRFGGPVAGVTGSAGKTTTKEFLAAMLEAHAPVGSFNNHVGVPLTLCRLPRDAAAFVAEVGMNRPGEIAPLVKLVQPQVALVVNVMPVHVEGLGSVENIRKEKLSIAEGLPVGGTLVVPEGLDVSGVRGDVKVVRFNPTAVLPVEIVEPSPARIACANAALAVCRVLGKVDAAMLGRLAGVGVQAGRGAAEVVNGVTVIDDSFNGNPASMAAALSALKAREVKGKRVAVLGDMLELGEGAVGYHVGLAPSLAGIDGVFCVGPLMAHVYELLEPAQRWGCWENPAEVDYGQIAESLAAGDAVVVKGSKRMLYVQGAVGEFEGGVRGERVKGLMD